MKIISKEQWLAILEQSQVFASAWAFVDGPFDDGSGMKHACEVQAELAAMFDALPDAGFESIAKLRITDSGEYGLHLLALGNDSKDPQSAYKSLVNRLGVGEFQLSLTEPPELAELRRKAAAYDAINTPEIDDFLAGVKNEALYQRELWGIDHDAGKTDADWFWLVGHLASKALLKTDKSLHHIITTAAALLNWHAAKIGAHNAMRPGIGPDKQPPKPEAPNNHIESKTA